jgi:hypothetical protein
MLASDKPVVVFDGQARTCVSITFYEEVFLDCNLFCYVCGYLFNCDISPFTSLIELPSSLITKDTSAFISVRREFKT